MARQSSGFYVAMVFRFFVLLFAVVVLMKIYIAREESPVASIAHVSFPSAVHVADVTLPAGSYRVKQTADSDQQFVVFTAVPEGNTYKALCRLESLSVAANKTEQQYTLGPSGEMRLVALTLEGEPFKHVFWDGEQGR